MKNIVALGFIAIGLCGCAAEPTWNTSVFPEQPTYGMPGSAAPAVAEAPKK
jgi:hypothetical protein